MVTKKSVTIDLTPKQQEKLRKVVGGDLTEIRVEVSRGRTAKKPLSAKVAPSAIFKTGDRVRPPSSGFGMA